LRRFATLIRLCCAVIIWKELVNLQIEFRIAELRDEPACMTPLLHGVRNSPR
jgi:hypothetical protein